MLEKCANPACCTPFRRLGRGKLFAFEIRAVAESSRRLSHAVRAGSGTTLFFWLCDACSSTTTLGLDFAGRPIIQKLEERVDDAFEGSTLKRENQFSSI
jgi:hypothetical protein